MRFNRSLQAALSAALAAGVASSASAAEVRLPMFDDHFVSGWETHQAELGETGKIAYKGNRSIELKLGGGGDGWHKSYELIYGWTEQFTAEPFDHVEFYIHGGEQGGQTIKMTALVSDPNKRPDRGGHSSAKTITLPDPKYIEGGTIPAGKWAKVTIPIKDLELPNPRWFRGFRIHTDDDKQQLPVYIDEVALVGEVAETARINVDTTDAVRPVNDHIFGICTYSTPGADNPGEVAAAIDADYEMQRVFYPTFNMRGWRVNIQKGMLFAEATDAEMVGTVNFSDQPPKQMKDGQPMGEYGTPQEAAAYVAYANVPVDAPKELLDLKLGVDRNGYDWKTVGYWVDLRANQKPLAEEDGYNQMRIQRKAPWGVKYWELDNEPWLHADRKDWLLYANFCKEADALMKKVDPTILTAPTIQWNAGEHGKVKYTATNPDTGETSNGGNHVIPYFLAGHDERSPGRYVPDFVVVHNYAGGSSGNADLVTLLTHQQDGGGSWTQQIRGVRDLMTAYYGEEDGRKPFIAISEWNMRPTFPLSRQYSSIVGALYVANSLGAALQSKEGDIEIMTIHDWADGPMDKGGFYENPNISGWRHETGYGIYRDSGETRYPIHYAFKMLSRFMAETGDTVVQAKTDELMLQPYAVKQRNGNLAILLINKHPSQAINADLQLSGFKPGQQATVYTYGPEQDRAEADIQAEQITYDGKPLAVGPYTMKLITLTPATAEGGQVLAPNGVVAVPGDGQVKAMWDAVAGATAYDVLRGQGNDGLAVIQKDVKQTTFTDTTAANGQRYRYSVIARNASSASDQAEIAIASPQAAPTAPPQQLKAIGADGEVVLNWQPVEGASSYTVKRASSKDGPFEIITTNPYKRDVKEQRIRTEHHDRDVERGKTYHYQVVATTAGGDGPAATVSATPTALPDGWQSTDTTGRSNTGTSYFDSAARRFVLAGEGNGEYDGGDGRFVYKKVSGDFDIQAKVVAAGSGQYGKNNHGVHLRSDLHKNPPFWATMGATPTHGNFTQGPQFYLWSPETKRLTHRDADDRTGRSGEPRVPYYVRLQRKGSTITGMVSTDGRDWKTWKEVDVPSLPQDLYVGLLSQSNYPYATSEGVFEELKLQTASGASAGLRR